MNKVLYLLCLFATSAYGQKQSDTITVKKLNEVVIRPYFTLQPLMQSTGSVVLIDSSLLSKQPSNSLLSAMNTASGVRMEERSPGSYRLSIRGSLLRSPFGIRNIKIYMDEFPLTDAGGNSYLNALDVSAIQSIQVLKGPHSSIFGANSGGVVLLAPRGTVQDSLSGDLTLQGGSFGMLRQTLSLGRKWNKYSFNFSEGYQRSDGYRDHSGMSRKFVQLNQVLNYSKDASLRALAFYSDLHYNTPGGLTLAQFDLNPSASRPAAGPNRGAEEQRAGIYSKTIYGGISNEWIINKNLKNVVALFGSFTDFKNPFITNYEQRKEYTGGIRTYLEYLNVKPLAAWKLNVGLESMKTSSDVSNFDNNFGTAGATQSKDDLTARSNFAFAHVSVDFAKRLLVELSASANLYGYSYKNVAPISGPRVSNNFDLQIMPRLALSYFLSENFALRSSISKGYSPPTLAEIRASNQVINADLQPEYGWNYEAGLRYSTLNEVVFIDINGFFFNLKDAIVRRLTEGDAEYFINAGGTKQWGLETSLSAWLIRPKTSGFVRSLQLRNAYTLSRFTFDNYTADENDYSGKLLTGVPKGSVISSIDISLPADFNLFVQHNYTSRIPLNDGNTAFATDYHLLQARATKTFYVNKIPVDLFVGADNLFNEKYSLGNDLNAFGGRYFNAAATRNFYGGLAVKFR